MPDMFQNHKTSWTELIAQHCIHYIIGIGSAIGEVRTDLSSHSGHLYRKPNRSARPYHHFLPLTTQHSIPDAGGGGGGEGRASWHQKTQYMAACRGLRWYPATAARTPKSGQALELPPENSPRTLGSGCALFWAPWLLPELCVQSSSCGIGKGMARVVRQPLLPSPPKWDFKGPFAPPRLWC